MFGFVHDFFLTCAQGGSALTFARIFQVVRVN